MGMADLNNFTGGAWPWFEEQVKLLHGGDLSGRTGPRTVLLTHQPFRCRFPIPVSLSAS